MAEFLIGPPQKLRIKKITSSLLNTCGQDEKHFLQLCLLYQISNLVLVRQINLKQPLFWDDFLN